MIANHSGMALTLKEQMASFYIHDGAQALTLQIIGALTQRAAAELEQTWLTARSTLAGRELLIDLGDVTSADDVSAKQFFAGSPGMAPGSSPPRA